MIHLREASKSFGRTRAVRGVSFELHPGQIAGLLGPNGAGKTTTIRMIAGYIAPDAGRITIDGIDPARDPIAARRRIGYLPESAPLYPEISATRYLDYRARLFNLGRTDRRRAVARAIDRCRLDGMAHKRIGVLSKGYRQRVGLAAAILHDPPVLILDEPTNGLDPSQIITTRALIRDLSRDRTVLLSTHLVPEVERSCDRALVIARGRLIADDTPERLASGAGAGGHRFTIECAGPDDDALRASLSRHLGPETAVEPGRAEREGWVRLTVTTTPVGDDPGESLALAAADAGRAVRLLAPERGTLEDRLVALIEAPEEGE